MEKLIATLMILGLAVLAYFLWRNGYQTGRRELLDEAAEQNARFMERQAQPRKIEEFRNNDQFESGT